MVAYLKYETIKLIPIVELSPGGECIKVVNFENGEAFNCQDVDVLLRRYRTVYAKSNSPEKAGN